MNDQNNAWSGLGAASAAALGMKPEQWKGRAVPTTTVYKDLLSELKSRRDRASTEAHHCENRARDLFNAVADYERAIAALEPAPAEPEAEPVAPDVEIPEGFTIWAGDNFDDFCAFNTVYATTKVEAILRNGERTDGLAVEFVWTQDDEFAVHAYRMLEAPAQPDPLSAELRSDPGSEEEVRDQIEIPEGFTKWEGGECPVGPDVFVDVIYRDGESEEFPMAAEDISWAREGFGDDIIAYRVIQEQPADETHTDDLRTAEGEAVAGDDRIETQSVLDDPDFQARVEAAREQEAAAEPAYVGLQDPELDADWDAMKARQEAGKKLHFSIFGKREEV